MGGGVGEVPYLLLGFVCGCPSLFVNRISYLAKKKKFGRDKLFGSFEREEMNGLGWIIKNFFKNNSSPPFFGSFIAKYRMVIRKLKEHSLF